MLFAAGIVILALTTLAGAAFLVARKGKLPAHGSREARPMYALALGYLAGGVCVFVSLVMLAARWLP